MEIQGCISSLVSQFEPLMAELILIVKVLISVEEKDLLDS